jgi:predicted secreted Zn-dependent protease
MTGRSAGFRAPLATSVGLTLTAVLLAGCLGLPSPTTQPPSTTSTIAPTSSAGTSPSGTTSPSPRPSAATGAELLPISGVWRVRKVLRPEDRSGLIADPTFDEETYSIEADCDQEPCATLKVTTTPLGLSSPATSVDMERTGATYASEGLASEGSSCLTGAGDRVDGGASTTSTLRLWVATDRPAGSSVASTALHGTIDLAVTPTTIGEAAGCEPQGAAFELTGRREEVAVRDPDGSAAGPDVQPPRGATRVALPALSARVPGATVKYFSIRGDTSIELAESVGRGGAKACGTIDYEWYRGDARPSACTLTRLSDTRQSIRISNSSSGSCRIRDADISASYTIYIPRWTEPSRVPKRLLDWWHRIVDFIADHEAGHVRIGRSYIRRLNDRLVGKPCEDLGSIVRTWVRQHAAAQEAYDRTEYSRPWPRPAAGY